jgi:hypothetical protein
LCPLSAFARRRYSAIQNVYRKTNAHVIPSAARDLLFRSHVLALSRWKKMTDFRPGTASVPKRNETSSGFGR